MTPSYGKCFASLALGLAPMFLVFAIAALFGYDTVRVNRQAIHGPLALVYSVAMTLFLAAAMAGFQKLGYAIFAFGRPTGRDQRLNRARQNLA